MAVVIILAKCAPHTSSAPVSQYRHGIPADFHYLERDTVQPTSGLAGMSHTPDIEWEGLPFSFLDESLLADIDACLTIRNQLDLAAAHNSSEDDSDDISAY
ncbi:uncharacterized protein Aud_005579 [Aspergillus udagawae]|uniref:Uncharacterized protein n=1 Tax=Aspergillus udagawae TaxID=91492 RepID=A0A8E0QUP8_9EURO|nr:uncharacterized protein Aud_005579 [Aspergillus udagawae]GIC89176.1 hypothetical protein Aud_005579 [Aspergillus udagawae]